MGKRRKAREAAIQYHFWRDLQHGEGPEQIDDFWEFCPATPRVREFAQPLIEGMVTHIQEIDERIRRYCENYEFHRISAVDRNVSITDNADLEYVDVSSVASIGSVRIEGSPKLPTEVLDELARRATP